MKLKKLLPITLLALLSLASCDPIVDPTDSDTTPPTTDSTSDPTTDDPSTDPSTDPVDDPVVLSELIAGLDEGLASEDDLYLILENIDQASEGINATIFERIDGQLPGALTDPSKAYWEDVSGYGLIDGDAVEVGVETELSLAELDDDGGYVLGESFPYINEVMTVWDDGEEVHLTNLSEDDVDDPYSFAISADSEDVDIEDFKAFVNSGMAYDYMYLAELAYQAFAGGDDFVEVTLIAQAEKVVDAEDGDYLNLKYYTTGSWYGVYSCEAAWGPDYAGYYVDRVEAWGFEAIIDADGHFVAAYNYYDHFIEFLYEDLNWEEGDPAPSGPFDVDLEKLDLVLDEEAWGRFFDVTIFIFSSLDGIEIELPDLEDYRAADASDSTYFFDLEDYGFEIE